MIEISDQNHINIEVIFLYFSTNQLKTQNTNILENPAQKLINRKISRLQYKLVNIRIWLVQKCLCTWILGPAIKLNNILFFDPL